MQSRKALQYIEMHKDDTVRDLKVRVSARAPVAQIYKLT